MKPIFSTLILAIPFLIVSCNNSETYTTNESSEQIIDSVASTSVSKNENSGNQKTKLAYVTNLKGLDIKEKADSNSKTLVKLKYGDQLEILETSNDWLLVYRKDKPNGFVKKNFTGKLEDLKLIESDLYEIISLTKNEKTENYEKGKLLEGYLKIELIDESEFMSKMSNAVNFLIADTTLTVKQNGIIELKCEKKIKRYVDKPSDNADVEFYKYLGQFNFCNKYVVLGSYYESGDYNLIDKISGEQTLSIEGSPHISADRKYLYCIYDLMGDFKASFGLYSIEGDQIKHIVNLRFNNWTIGLGRNLPEIFSCSDRYLYVPISNVKMYSENHMSANDKIQYIRIQAVQ